jgi:hypothetical protein
MDKSKKQKSQYQKWGLIIFFIFLGFILVNSFFGKSTNQKNLERDYEVLDFRCISNQNQDLTFSIVEMKSFGNRNDQVWKGLKSLGRECPDSESYYIEIIEETRRCIYIIPGNIYGGYVGKEVINDTEIMKELLYLDWKGFVTGSMVDEVYKQYDIPFSEKIKYQKIDEEGITKRVLFSIINHHINRFPACY